VKQVLSPKELAQAIGVSESSLKRWADDGLLRATRTAGGHRRIPIAEAIRFVRQSQATLVRPEILGLPDVEAVSGHLPARDDEADTLFGFLREGAAREARGLVMSMYLSGRSVADICDGPIREALQQLGELWRHDPQGIFIEHRATDICMQAVNQLRTILIVPDNGPVAVGGAPAGDPYIVPSLMTAAVLAAEGFQAINLGADTPAQTLRHAAEHHEARLVWLSATGVTDAETLRAFIEALADELAHLNASLVLGGRARNLAGPIDRTNVHIGASMAELVAFAKGLRLASGRTSTAPSNGQHR